MNKKSLLGMTAVGLIALSGCGSSEEVGTVALVTDSGGVNDKSFNQNSHDALTAYAEEEGYKYEAIESKEVSQLEQNLNAAASRNEVVVASGYLFEQPMYKAATANPETDFVCIDCIPNNGKDYEELDNVKSYLFNEQDSGYLAGYIAGETTKTDKVAIMGGQKVPAVEHYVEGFTQGVEDANKEAEVNVVYTETFTDVAIGKTTAQAFLSQGNDIVFTAAGGANQGAIEAIKEERMEGNNDVWAIGVDSDMYADGLYNDEDSLILTSALKNTGLSAVAGVTEHFDGTFKGGTTTLGYKDNGACDLPKENPNVDKALVEQAKHELETHNYKWES